VSARQEAWLTPQRLLALVATLVGAYAAIVVVRALRDVLVMLLVALFLSFAMEPAVQFLARRGWRRGIATAAVFAGFIVGGVLVVAAMAPLVVDQVTGLLRSMPSSVDDAIDAANSLPFVDLEASPALRREISALGERFGERVGSAALSAAGDVLSLGATALGLLVQILAIGLVTFYLVADGPRFRRTLARPLPPARQREMLVIWEIAVAKTGGYIYSRMLLAVVAAVVHAVALLMLEVPFPLPLGIWMGLMTAFVPVVGVYLGGLLLLLVAATNEPGDALWVVILILAYQQVENYVLAPRVQARTMDLHPAVAFVAVLAGATLLGAVGALLALPVAAISKALLSAYVRRHELIDELGETGELPPAAPVIAPEAMQ
jgi:predicted PurR-regulated permease PerM